MAADNARMWTAAVALGLALAGPQAVATAFADTGDTDTAAAPSAATGRAEVGNRSPIRAARPAAARPTAVPPRTAVSPRPASSTAARSGARTPAVRTQPRPAAPIAPTVSADGVAPQPVPSTPITAAVPRPNRTAALVITRRSPADTAETPIAAVGAAAPANPIADLVDGITEWVGTYANLYPWWSGSLLPAPVKQFFFNATPVAAPMQIEVDLGRGVSSGAIPFTATDPDGNPLRYTVPDKGMPGGPQHGTVAVDNATGTFVYTPDTDYVGTDTFSFVASDDTTPHTHAWAGLLNAAFGLLGLAGGHRTTATVTMFNNLDRTPEIVGEFSLLTYDVSGLPFPFSGAAWPRITNTWEIGPRLNAFDIVNVQTDVAYHPFLVAGTAFPDRTAPSVPSWAWPVGAPFSDGLNSLSAYYIESLNRQTWNGRPALPGPGGFTYTRQHIPGGSSVDVYNVDAGAGALGNDELAQLSSFIAANSLGRAVIVAGDFGQFYSDPGQGLSAFAAANGLTDAWVHVEYGGTTPTDAQRCAYDDSCEQRDKVFYRDAAPLLPGDQATSPVRLQALAYTNEGLNFRNAAGQDLAAHRPQSVTFGYTVDATGPLNVDLENWMADLPEMAGLPLTALAIPGTHDSGSYGITPASPWALTGKDQFGFLTELPGFLQDLVVKPIAAGWGKTQSKTLYQQFTDGIRYVDLRLTNEPDGTVYLEHGLRADPFSDAVDDIAAFSTTHPRELLVVYVQGIKNFNPDTHAEVVAQMKAVFGDRMVPRELTTAATLADLWAIDKNVIVVYNNAAVVAADPELWPDATLYRPWPQVASVPALLAGNETNLANRPPAAIWGMFGESTPALTNYATGILTLGTQNIEQFMFNVHPPAQQWIRSTFKGSINLTTADWYQQFWPAGSGYARDTVGAVYETLGQRLAATRVL